VPVHETQFRIDKKLGSLSLRTMLVHDQLFHSWVEYLHFGFKIVLKNPKWLK